MYLLLDACIIVLHLIPGFLIFSTVIPVLVKGTGIRSINIHVCRMLDIGRDIMCNVISPNDDITFKYPQTKIHRFEVWGSWSPCQRPASSQPSSWKLVIQKLSNLSSVMCMSSILLGNNLSIAYTA